MKTYTIIRFYQEDGKPSEIKNTGLTKEEAQDWCNSKESHGKGWFDGYQED